MLQFLRRLAGRFDYMQIVPMLTLLAIGALFIYGTGQQVGGVHAEVFWKRQLFYMGLGFTAWLILSFTDYRWFGPASFVLYPLSILLLGYVLLNGVERFGARRWLDIAGMSITERAKMGIGYAFQQPPRFKGLTVRRLLSLAHGSELPEDQCCSYLTKVGLCSKDYLNREVDASLSGGEVKRIEIATLMARDLKLAIYDEPEAGIDLWSFTMLVESFKSMMKNRRESVIIISHQERIMQLADEIIIIADGKIRDRGPKDEIFPKLMGEFSEGCDFRGKEG